MSHPKTIKGAAPFPENAPSKTNKPQHNKETTILAILRQGRSLNRFEAERFGDHCLHSTISTLRSKGYQFYDQWEWVNTRFGKEVHVKRYSYIRFARGQA